MSNYHRFFKLGSPPGKREHQVVLYADQDGALRTVDEDGTNAAVGGGGGGSQPGAGRWIGPFLFQFDTPNLNAGVEFYTPTPGDWLLDAVLAAGLPDPLTDSPWDGTTPLADFGYASEVNGFFAFNGGNPPDMTNPATASYSGQSAAFASSNSSSYRLLTALLAGAGGLPNMEPPFQFVTAAPLSVWVSQDGTAGGDDPGATHGAGGVYLCVATPAAP